MLPARTSSLLLPGGAMGLHRLTKQLTQIWASPYPRPETRHSARAIKGQLQVSGDSIRHITTAVKESTARQGMTCNLSSLFTLPLTNVPYSPIHLFMRSCCFGTKPLSAELLLGDKAGMPVGELCTLIYFFLLHRTEYCCPSSKPLSP